MSAIQLTKEYAVFFQELKDRVLASQNSALRAVNKELILLYHHIGLEILRQQRECGWGSKVIDQLSKDLRSTFPGMKGFSSRNLNYMRRFAEVYEDREFVQEVLAQISWYHHITLLDKVSEASLRLFYIHQAIENGWSRNVMVMQLEKGLHQRVGKSVTNFAHRLPSPHGERAQNTLKDPYVFDFLMVGDEAHEVAIEKGLVGHIERFLLELGAGFTFVGRQYNLEVGGQDFYLDLLFYHLKLRSFVVIEIKNGDFKPEYVGKLNFYLSAVDDLLRHPTDNPSIGLILCKSKNNILAEYALRDVSKPIGLSEYRLAQALPEHIQTALPTIEEIEAEMRKLPAKGMESRPRKP